MRICFGWTDKVGLCHGTTRRGWASRRFGFLLAQAARDRVVAGWSFSNGGGGGSRTHVFLPLRRNFYMRSFIIDLDRVWG